jgi:hypothetical protein
MTDVGFFIQGLAEVRSLRLCCRRRDALRRGGRVLQDGGCRRERRISLRPIQDRSRPAISRRWRFLWTHANHLAAVDSGFRLPRKHHAHGAGTSTRRE